MASRKTNKAATGAEGKRSDEGDGRRDGLGDALRTVYGDTLGEEIPADLLALLSKLD